MAIRVCAIAACSENRVIGIGGKLPWHIPEDLKHFKKLTLGKPVVMGRKTFESIGNKPLPKRPNIVVSRSRLLADGIVWAGTIADALRIAKEEAEKSGQKEIMICGGGKIYADALPFTDRIYLTLIHQNIVNGDAFFPEIDESTWHETARENYDGYSFVTMDRK